jgi:desulfoferrodoxin (superoxide reductase-like protein)
MKWTIVLIATVWLLAMVSSVFGHPPQSVKTAFISELGLLTIAVGHDSKDVSKHFVNKIEVNLNGKKIIEQEFGSQENDDGQIVLYRVIDARAGDKLEVVASCNIQGKKKVEIEVD